VIRVTADSDYSKVVSHAIGDGCGPIFGQTNEVFLGPKIEAISLAFLRKSLRLPKRYADNLPVSPNACRTFFL